MNDLIKEIESIKIIDGESNMNMFSKKYLNRNILMKDMDDRFRPSDIYDFYYPLDKYHNYNILDTITFGSRFTDESWNSHFWYYKMKHKKNRYFINFQKMSCTCKSYKYSKQYIKTCKHLTNYYNLYNFSLVLNQFTTISMVLDLTNEYKSYLLI